jgi:hypothetical protein
MVIIKPYRTKREGSRGVALSPSCNTIVDPSSKTENNIRKNTNHFSSVLYSFPGLGRGVLIKYKAMFRVT